MTHTLSFLARVGDKVLTGDGPGMVVKLKGSFALVELADGARDYFYREWLRPLDG